MHYPLSGKLVKNYLDAKQAKAYHPILMSMPLSKVERAVMSKIGRQGGKARAKILTKQRKIEIARMGGKARAAKRGNGS